MRVKEYKGYTVYSDGRIMSNGKRKVFLKGYDVGKGYDTVKINGKNYYRHRVISDCFLGERPDGFTVNHIDGDKMNNSLVNLEYITFAENYKHALDNNLKKNLGYYLTADDASELIECYHNSDATMSYLPTLFGFKDKGVFSRLMKGNYTYNFKKK